MTDKHIWENGEIITADLLNGMSGYVDDKVNSVYKNAVGTNLLTNASDFSSNWSTWPGQLSISKTTEYNGHPSLEFTSSSSTKLDYQQVSVLENSTQYTSSFWAKADNAGDKVHNELWGSSGAKDFILTTDWVRYTALVTSSPDANTNTSHASYNIGVLSGNKGNVYIALPKLEKGSIATDWCHNPADILTQSDYAKIQAAIVALGGSLK